MEGPTSTTDPQNGVDHRLQNVDIILTEETQPEA